MQLIEAGYLGSDACISRSHSTKTSTMDHQQAERHSKDQQIPATPPAVPAKNRYPPGYRFMPTDTELILEYLQKKIAKEPIPISEINETNLKHVNPRNLTAKFPKLGDNEWYFFTPRDRKYPNGERPDRGSDSGYWKATGADKPVKVGDTIVGFRKALVFYEGKPQKGQKTNWIMHEFRVNGAARKKRTADDMRLDDWVLCRMYEKASRLTNNRKNRNAKEQCDGYAADESPLQESSGDHGESAAIANQKMVANKLEIPPIFPENPYSFNNYPEPNIINTGFGDWSLQDLLHESDPPIFPENPYSFNNLDGIVSPVEQVNAFGNPHLNEQPLGFQQPNASSWTSNEAFLPSYSVPANNTNTNTNFSPIYSQMDAQQDKKRFRY